MARASASLRGTFFTLIGATVTFSSTVLWAKRLKDWNTIPTSERRAARPGPEVGSGEPSIRISPSSIVSSRLMARHRVDLPEPEGPSTTTTSPAETERSMSLRTWRSPKCFCTPRSVTSSAASGPAAPGSSDVVWVIRAT